MPRPAGCVARARAGLSGRRARARPDRPRGRGRGAGDRVWAGDHAAGAGGAGAGRVSGADRPVGRRGDPAPAAAGPGRGARPELAALARALGRENDVRSIDGLARESGRAVTALRARPVARAVGRRRRRRTHGSPWTRLPHCGPTAWTRSSSSPATGRCARTCRPEPNAGGCRCGSSVTCPIGVGCWPPPGGSWTHIRKATPPSGGAAFLSPPGDDQLPMLACGPAYFASSAGTSAAASRVYE
jgi:hypothetical protein